MSSITSAQPPLQTVKNSMQDLQKSTSLHGRVFHKISDGGNYIIQSISNVVQLVLSQCIYVVSFGRYNLDILKSYLFPSQTALKGDETASSNNLSTSCESPPSDLKGDEIASSNNLPTPCGSPPSDTPVPPPMPTKEDLNRSSSSDSVKMQESSFQGSIVSEPLNKPFDLRSSVNSTQDFPKEDDHTLEDGTNSRRSSLHEDLDPAIEEQSNNNFNISPQKKKSGIQKKIKQGRQVVEGLFAGVQSSPLFQKKQKEFNPKETQS